jgi:hypothetical protein
VTLPSLLQIARSGSGQAAARAKATGYRSPRSQATMTHRVLFTAVVLTTLVFVSANSKTIKSTARADQIQGTAADDRILP